jgi:hypothetical protein
LLAPSYRSAQFPVGQPVEPPVPEEDDEEETGVLLLLAG